ncbi:protein FAM166B isoform X2 [Callorhinchus milii]|uniref:protein FAM166B isoform X2 n=1 Tax=Callorhinchus milii TaxID=7868 RepID=UPI0004571D1E|nr:protein FAM166B isoform X2 [Callorhinchus milii]|eukprot:gi/632958982/ref/XP_007895358.1/ PREDICTED: protein FAM166B isoform X2 [Callorhinchus milii]
MAKQFPPKISSILMTPDPHYIPGYGGYCPQYKYSVGQSYGKLTSKLLTDPGIARSGRLILQPTHLPAPSIDEGTNHQLRSCKVSWADQKLNDVMIPGYTGFIPNMEHYFSKTYTKTCKDAIRQFEREQLKIATKKRELELITSLQSGNRKARTEQEKKLLTVRCSMPLRPTGTSIPPYNSPYSYKALGSPYLMANENPHKHFISETKFQFGHS